MGRAGSRVPNHTRELIIRWYFEEGLDVDECAHRGRCHRASVYRYLDYYVNHGTLNNPSVSLNRLKPSQVAPFGSLEICEWVKEQYRWRPTLYLDELQERLEDDWGLFLSIATISRHLRSPAFNFRRKKLSKEASERNEWDRAAFTLRMANYTPEMIVALDESGMDDRHARRQYGRAFGGQRCVSRQPFGRGVRTSMFSALTVKGVSGLQTFEGGGTGARFVDFLRDQVLPLCGQFDAQEDRSVLLLDNAAIHHIQEVRDICEAAGVRLEYLPAYSPDFNPIEETFSFIKAHVRRNESQWLENGHEGRVIALENACAAVTEEHSRAWFGDCGYA